MSTFPLSSHRDIPVTELKKPISANSNFLLFFVVNVKASDLYVKTETAVTDLHTQQQAGYLP